MVSCLGCQLYQLMASIQVVEESLVDATAVSPGQFNFFLPFFLLCAAFFLFACVRQLQRLIRTSLPLLAR